jgi:hypothetical protein
MVSIKRQWSLAAGLAIIAFLALPLSAGASAALPSPSHALGALASSPSFVRGVYGKDASSTGYQDVAASGFNSVMTGPYTELLDRVTAAGLKGIVWLGNFLNAPTCGFEKNDATITRLVDSIAGNPAITAYYLGDEPHVTECPNAPALFRQRSELVHALDPGSQTFTVIQASENGVSHDYAPWTGAVDVIGFDVYPCAKSSTRCNFDLIDQAIAAIRTTGITRYWAILQDFQDCYYRLPTPAEIAGEFDHWARSQMSGYFVFSWNYQPADPKCVGVSLDAHADNIAQLRYENSRTFGSSSHPSQRSSSDQQGAAPTSAVVAILIIGGALALLSVVAVRAKPRRG